MTFDQSTNKLLFFKVIMLRGQNDFQYYLNSPFQRDDAFSHTQPPGQ